MSKVAGVDFGTLSVRVSLFDSEKGRLGSGTADYPLHRKKEDPDHATQSHADHMAALALATHRALETSSRLTARISKPSPSTPPAPPSSPSTTASLRSTTTTSGATTAPGRKPPRSPPPPAPPGSKPSIGAAASTPPNGASPSSSTGSATIPKSAPASPPPSNTATWSPPSSAASPTPPRSPAASAPWATSGCGTESLGGLPPESFLTALDPVLAGVRSKLNGRYATSDQIAGHLSPEWAAKLGLRPGIPIPVGAFDAHWDAIGAGVRIGDVVNVVGTSTCIMAIGDQPTLIPGVCGVVPGSIHPGFTGIEAGLSATGDIFDAIARRAGTTVAELSRGLENYRAGETGLLRLTWDNGDRTVLVNPELSGVTLGWRLTTTAQDELFAAIEGTAFHTRVILERMEEYGVPVRRIINGGGIPQKNAVLNQVYANVMGKPILVPGGDVTSLGSAIFAFMAAGAFRTIEEAQERLCPPFKVIEPRENCDDLYAIYRELYFSFGRGETLPQLRRIAARARGGKSAGSSAS